ncbi:hypothetical protein COO60DRAFT_909699 [Scenedesmus sp. NREL 46B-D3]|nr:hypothetical protein COO60DRAFT_909699 [Scenedesmus sp. NREL 46B-D3]
MQPNIKAVAHLSWSRPVPSVLLLLLAAQCQLCKQKHHHQRHAGLFSSPGLELHASNNHDDCCACAVPPVEMPVSHCSAFSLLLYRLRSVPLQDRSSTQQQQKLKLFYTA